MAKARRRSEETKGEAPALGAALEFLQLLWGISHALNASSKLMHRRLGVTGPQRLSVRIIGRQSSISAGELASILQLHPGTLTGIVERLCTGGYVARRPDPGDGRRAQLTLTAKGRRLDAVKTGTVEAAVQRALRRLNGKQLSSVRTALRYLRQELEADL